MSVNDFREKNRRIFDIIRDSIQINHDFKIRMTEEWDAAVMFLRSVDWEAERVKTLPVWKPKGK